MDEAGFPAASGVTVTAAAPALSTAAELFVSQRIELNQSSLYGLRIDRAAHDWNWDLDEGTVSSAHCVWNFP